MSFFSTSSRTRRRPKSFKREVGSLVEKTAEVIEAYEKKYLEKKELYDTKIRKFNKMSMYVMQADLGKKEDKADDQKKQPEPAPTPAPAPAQPFVLNLLSNVKLFRVQGERFDGVFRPNTIRLKPVKRYDPSMDVMSLFQVTVT